MYDMQIDPRQITAGRALLGWTISDFAKRTGLSINSIRQLELTGTDHRKIQYSWTATIAVAVLIAEGVAFERRDGRAGVSIGVNSKIDGNIQLEALTERRLVTALGKLQVQPMPFINA